LVVFCIADASGQQKRRTKKSRRVTNPVQTTSTSATPTTNEPTIISTDDGTTATDSGSRRSTARRTTPPPQSNEDLTRQQVDKLSAQVSALNEKLSLMEQQQRTLVEFERLTRAEARAETLRAQLRDVQTKETDFQSRLEQLDYELQPTVIERTLATSGSTRPEELRELRRRQLENEKSRLQTQLNQIVTSRTRLETAIANADAEADRIRARVEAQPVTPTEPTEAEIGGPSVVVAPTGEPADGEPR
jgi:chromosome segregation ATPase